MESGGYQEKAQITEKVAIVSVYVLLYYEFVIVECYNFLIAAVSLIGIQYLITCGELYNHQEIHI